MKSRFKYLQNSINYNYTRTIINNISTISITITKAITYGYYTLFAIYKKNSKLYLEIINGQFKLFIAHYNIILLIIKNID
jgi:hypothetical protein